MAGYTRQSSFADGDTITAALFNDEYNQLVNAFSNTTGHSHDGTAASGPVIGLIGDAGETSPNNKVLIDTTNNYIEFYVEVSSSPVQQLYIADGAIVPVTDSDVDLGTSSLYFKDSYIDTVTTTGNVAVGGNLTVTGNATISGNLTFGDAATDTVAFSADVASNLLPSADNTYDIGASGSEWKDLYIDGTAYVDAINYNGTAITSTAAELNILDGVTSTAAELNILDGVTATTAELNIMDGVTATTAELNIMDGVTATTAEINTLDGITSTVAELNILDGVTSTAAEINLLDGVTSTTAELNILDGVTATAAEINLLDGVTSTTAELNILDGVTSTATELNIVDGTTTATATTLADADRVVVNDAGTMVQVALTDFETYFESALDTLSNVTTVGALNAGSITSGFGAIDNGSSAITTTGTVTYGSLSDGTITITAFVDEDDMSSDSATLVPTQQSVKAYVDAQILTEDTLAEMNDVNITTPADASLLFYDTTTSKWIDNVVSGDITIADTGVATIQANSVALSTDTTGDYVSTITAGTGLTSTGATSGEGIAHSLSVDASQTQITAVGTIGTGTWQGTAIADAYVANDLTISGGTVNNSVIGGTTPAAGTFTTLTANTSITGTLATAAQTNVTSVGTLSSLTVSGDVTVDTSTLKVDSTNNRVGIGNASPDVSLDIGSLTDAMHVPVGTTAQRPASPAAGYFRYNTTTSGFEGYTDSWGSIGGGGTAPIINTMTGDGSDTTLTLTSAPVNENATVVTIDGVVQHKDTYSVSGTTLTFSEAPPNGTAVECITWVNTTVSSALLLEDADSDTKVQVEESSDEDKIRFDTGGTERMIIDSTGVGIGTSSPDSMLHLYKATGSGALEPEIKIENNHNTSSETDGAGRLTFYSDDSNNAGIPDNAWLGQVRFMGDDKDGSATEFEYAYMVGRARDPGSGTARKGGVSFFTRDGNSLTETLTITEDKVGIGTTSPDSKMHLHSTGAVDMKFSSDTTGQTGSDGVLLGINSDGSTYLWNYENQYIYFGTNNTERMRITSAGNVGIGTTSPTKGNLVVSGAAYDSQLLIERTDTSSRWGLGGTDSGAFQIWDDNQGDASRLVINSSGNVGIGTTSPGMQLESKTSSAIYTIGATNSHGSTPRGLKIEYSGSAPDSTADYFIYCEDTVAARMFVASDGDVSTSDSGILTSDRSLKTDIADATSKLADINQLQVRNFKWTTDYHPNKQNKHIGFIADEFETVFPGLVRETENPIKGQDGTVKSIKYGALIPILVKALQEADDKIDALEARITALES